MIDPAEEPFRKTKLSITIDSDIALKLRKIQSRYIDYTGQNCNLSMLINLVLAAGLISAKRLKREDWELVNSVGNGKMIPFDNKTATKFVEKLVT